MVMRREAKAAPSGGGANGDGGAPAADAVFVASEAADEHASMGVQDHTLSVVARDDDDELARIRTILLGVHREYFALLAGQSPTAAGDALSVTSIIRRRKASVLSGCILAFSGIFPVGAPLERFELWRLAQMFGAICQEGVLLPAPQEDCPEGEQAAPRLITHLVAVRSDTEKVRKALRAAKETTGEPPKIVRPEWLHACFKEWAAVPVDAYLISPPQPSRTPPVEATPTNDAANDSSDCLVNNDSNVDMDPNDLAEMNAELAALEGEESTNEFGRSDDEVDENGADGSEAIAAEGGEDDGSRERGNQEDERKEGKRQASADLPPLDDANNESPSKRLKSAHYSSSDAQSRESDDDDFARSLEDELVHQFSP